jgi:hypothetical protein
MNTTANKKATNPTNAIRFAGAIYSLLSLKSPMRGACVPDGQFYLISFSQLLESRIIGKVLGNQCLKNLTRWRPIRILSLDPMLDGKLCSIYDNRPEVCRSFPQLEKPLFTSRLMGVIDNLAICPIAFNAYEELKTKLAWLKGSSALAC